MIRLKGDSPLQFFPELVILCTVIFAPHLAQKQRPGLFRPLLHCLPPSGAVAVGCGFPMYAILRAHPGLWRTSRPGCIAQKGDESASIISFPVLVTLRTVLWRRLVLATFQNFLHPAINFIFSALLAMRP